ncbi:MAG TPA: hypothetical protein VIW21_04970 [Chthoniobacterales bacterium]
MKATRAALGFRVKSGWATAVIVGGSSSAPRLCMSEVINLADPQAPETQQPYHAGFGTLETDEAKLKRRIQGVGRATEKSIVDLVQRRVKNGYAIARAALVVGSVIEPKSIANPHVRAHALEGQLFRTTLEAALQTRGIRCAIFRERDIYALAAKSLRRSPAQIKRALADLGRGEKHWRAEQKSAGLAAWLLL